MQLRVQLIISGRLLIMNWFLLLFSLLWNTPNVVCQKMMLLLNMVKMIYRFIISHLLLWNGNLIMKENLVLVIVNWLLEEVLRQFWVFIIQVQMQEKLCKGMQWLCSLRLNIRISSIQQESIQLLLKSWLRINPARMKMRILRLEDVEADEP